MSQILPSSVLQERFADLQLLRYEVPGFTSLPLRQKLLIYYLAEAALLGRDILWDQNCSCGLQLRQTLEAIYVNYDGPKDCVEWQAFAIYMKRVWFSNGIHHHYSCQKFVPDFSREFFLHEAKRLDASVFSLRPGETADQMLEKMADIIFCPDVMPRRVNTTDGEDLLLTSSCNYYNESITQAEAEAFYADLKQKADPCRPPMLGMNSRLERAADGTLFENVWRSGGLYGEAIDRICNALMHARTYAENERQKAVMDKLVSFYRSGDLQTFDEYNILWVQETESEVDFTNGFIEVYGDPLGLKASWEGYVNIIDHEATRRAKALSDNAQWFEDHSPVDPRFRKKECRGVSARVISAAMLGGDLYPASAIGINLPNSNWIRAEHGSKSVTIANLTCAYNKAAKGSGMRQEFVIDEATCQLLDKYGDVCDDLHTDLHECLGHGSGQLLPGVDADALRAYGSTIEEARADLFGLYYIADPKLVELGLLPDGEAYKSQYYSYLLNGLLTQMVRIEDGNNIEEAHMRNRALISWWTLANYPEAVGIMEKDGKHYVAVYDYAMLRQAFGTLLAEVQRIKSEGDYEAARQLVEQYGVKLDVQLHREIRERYRRLDIAPYKGFINPRYTLVRDATGCITDVNISYDEAYDEQMLRYGRQYRTLCTEPSPFVRQTEREIKKELRASMNGILSARMREAGMSFQLIFGTELPRLRSIADEFPCDVALAEHLWQQSIRETRLLAMMLMPPEDFTMKRANRWAETMMTAEEAQVLSKILLPHVREAKAISLSWLVEGHQLPATSACLCLRHLLSRGEMLSAEERQTIRECLDNLLASAGLHLRKAIQALTEILNKD